MTDQSRPIKICFVGLHSYSLFNERTSFTIGGAEVRSFLFSTALAQLSHYLVSYIVMDHGQPHREELRGVMVYTHSGYTAGSGPRFIQAIRAAAANKGRIFARTKQFPYRRLINPDPGLILSYAALRSYDSLVAGAAWVSQRVELSLRINDYTIAHRRYQIYDEVDADVYCVFGVTGVAGEVAAYCRQHGKRYVLFIADITNLDARYTARAQGVNQYSDRFDVCFYAIAQADLIITQLESQRKLLQECFSKSGLTIRNPIELADGETQPVAQPAERKIALWIGRADNFKKMPLLFIELTKACPDVEFVMIMNPQFPEVSERVYREKPANVTVIELVPYQEIEAYFARAFVFVSTSLTEGFPNTFLQAGKFAVPILSYCVDPDEFIEHFECGLVAHGNMANMIAGLQEIRDDWLAERRFSTNIYNYVREFHSLGGRVAELEAALQNLVAETNGATAGLCTQSGETNA